MQEIKLKQPPSFYAGFVNRAKTLGQNFRQVSLDTMGALCGLGHDLCKSAKYISASASFLAKLSGASDKTAKKVSEATKIVAIATEGIIFYTQGSSILTSKLAQSILAASGLTLAIGLAGKAGGDLGAKIIKSQVNSDTLHYEIGIVAGVISTFLVAFKSLTDNSLDGHTDDSLEFSSDRSMVKAVAISMVLSAVARITIETVINNRKFVNITPISISPYLNN